VIADAGNGLGEDGGNPIAGRKLRIAVARQIGAQRRQRNGVSNTAAQRDTLRKACR
jgi:hypothetical protein